MTPLMLALATKHRDVGALLVERGASLEAVDHFGGSVFVTAIYGGHDWLVPKLLPSPKLDAPTTFTVEVPYPLHIAAQHGGLGVVVALLAAGAKPDVTDTLSRTPLDVAEGEDVAKALREAGGLFRDELPGPGESPSRGGRSRLAASRR